MSAIGVAAAEVGEAADDAQDFAELVGTLPRHREGRDRTRTGAADATPLGILRDVVVLVEHRHQLVDDDAGILVVERVVLGRPVCVAVAPVLRRRLGLIGPAAGIDEYARSSPGSRGGRSGCRARSARERLPSMLECLTVVEDHQAVGTAGSYCAGT